MREKLIDTKGFDFTVKIVKLYKHSALSIKRRKYSMKKALTATIMTLILCVFTVFSLAGCGASQEDIDNAVNEATAPLNSQITAIEADIADKEATIAALEAEKNALMSEKASLEAEIAELEDECETLNEEKAALTAKVGALEASIAANETEITSLNSSISALNTEKATLAARVAELEEENAVLKNCLAGKHVINETAAVSYIYTWSETTPTSTKNYTCLHCEKAIEEAVSPSVWNVGDMVTYIAKDGKSYVPTVVEITDEKAVVVVNSPHFDETTIKNEEQCLALLKPVGARWPRSDELVWESVIKPWLLKSIPSSSGWYTFVYDVDSSAYKPATHSVASEGSFVNICDEYIEYKRVYCYLYIWDIPITMGN